MGGGPYYAYQGGSRILNATRVDQSGADDANVTAWTKANDFIIAINIHSNGKETVAAQYKLLWRNKTDSGTFADVAATGVINYSADTSLVNGNPIAVGGKKCDTQGDTWQAGEEVEEASLSDSIDLVVDYESEIHFALDCSGATDAKEYEFELWDSTIDESRGTCGATITMAAGAVTKEFIIDAILDPLWPYYKIVTIKGETGAGTNYQVPIEIGDSAGGDFNLEGRCTNFPQDIEVRDNDGETLLDFWIEDITADPIKLWVKVADDLGTDKDIQVYYGKSGETTASNGANTFIQYHGAATSEYSDPTIISSNFIYECKAKSTASTHDLRFGLKNAGLFDDSVNIESYTSTNLVYLMSYDEGSATTVSSEAPDFPLSTFVHLKITNDGSIQHGYVDGNEIGSGGSGLLPNENMGMFILQGTGTSEQEWSFIRKYNSPEPTFSSAGAEQSPGLCNFQIDGILKKTDTKEFTINSILEATNIKEFTIDAALTSGTTKEFTINGILKTIKTKEFTIDSILIKVGSKEFSIDSILQKTDTKEFSVNAILEQTNIKEFTIDGILVNRNDKDFTTNGYLVNRLSKEFSIDASLVNRYGKDFTIDGILELTTEKTFIIDAILTGGTTKGFSINAILEATQTKSFTINSILKSVNTKSFIIDSIIKKIGTKGFSADAFLVDRLIKEFTIDSFLQTTKTKPFSINSILKATQTKSFTTDSILEKTNIKEFAINSIFFKIIEKPFTIDVILISTETKTFTIDAILTGEVTEITEERTIIIFSETRTITPTENRIADILTEERMIVIR